ncbi:MAG: O-antigen ligase family protein [Sporomusaceae bacterium]|nr:O-antigen ligase family protein [Sporomusaceae bacterium]
MSMLEAHSKPFAMKGRTMIFLSVLLAVLLGVLTLNSLTEEQGHFSLLRFAVAGLYGYIVLFLTGFSLGSITRKAMVVLFLWLFFSLLSLLSALSNQDDLFGEVWQLFGVPVIFFLGFPYLTGPRGRLILAWGLVLAFAAYLVASLALYPVTTSYYKGVFVNANTMGLILVALSAGLFGLLRGRIATEQTLRQGCVTAALVLALGASVLLIIFTGSRTSFLAFLAMAGLFYGTLLLDRAKQWRWLWGVSGFAVLCSGIVLLLVLGGIHEGIFATMTDKFASNPDQTLLSGREFVWRQVFAEAEVLGHGNQYFTAQVGILAHNVYLAVLGTKGIFAFALLFFFHGLVCFLAFWQTIEKVQFDGYCAVPLFVMIAYLLIGLTESVGGILGNGLHAAFLLAVGLTIAREETESRRG